MNTQTRMIARAVSTPATARNPHLTTILVEETNTQTLQSLQKVYLTLPTALAEQIVDTINHYQS